MPNIVFKVFVHRTGERFECQMMAELIVGQPVTFRFLVLTAQPEIRKLLKHKDLIQSFTNKTATHFELSYIENRGIKLTIDRQEHSLIFENVHKKHQFAELFKIDCFYEGQY